jgi:pantetheine-phosphate adenylyltransferase
VTTGLCPGSFDPPTLGHVDILARALALFDRVVVGVVVNPSKSPLFDLGERSELLSGALDGRIEVVGFDGLLVDVAAEVGADVLVKGLRDTNDWEYEVQMAHMNRHLTGIETVFIPTAAAYRFISSSLVKEVWRLGGDVSGLVPAAVATALSAKEPS